MKVALVHDWLNQYGGAELVLEALHDLFPEAPIFTSMYWPQAIPAAYRKWDIRVSFLDRLPLVKTHHQPLLPPDQHAKVPGLGAGQRHAEVEGVQEAALGNPAPPFDQFGMHHGDLAGRPAEADEAELEPIAQGGAEGDRRGCGGDGWGRQGAHERIAWWGLPILQGRHRQKKRKPGRLPF